MADVEHNIELSELERRTSSLGITEQQARAGKKFVRTFLFSMDISSPLARMHVLTRSVMAFTLSVIAMLFFRTHNLDPVGLLILLGFTFLQMYLSGIISWVVRSYALVIPIAAISISSSWVIFNPDPGNSILFDIQVYSGMLNLNLGIWHLAFAIVAGLIFMWRKKFLLAFLGGFIVAALVHRLIPGAYIGFLEIPFLSEWRIIISDTTLYTAFVKALGFMASAFIALGYFMTIRDVEVSGLMGQLGFPNRLNFFAILAARSFSMATNDYRIVDQAQVARGKHIQERTFLKQVRDFGQMAVPLIVMMISRSNEISSSLKARGFTRSKKMTNYRDTYPIKWFDWLVVVLFPLFMLGLILTDFNLTKLIFPALIY